MAEIHKEGPLERIFRDLAEREKLHFELIEWIFGEETSFRLET
jgi:hypothetical protein